MGLGVSVRVAVAVGVLVGVPVFVGVAVGVEVEVKVGTTNKVPVGAWADVGRAVPWPWASPVGVGVHVGGSWNWVGSSVGTTRVAGILGGGNGFNKILGLVNIIKTNTMNKQAAKRAKIERMSHSVIFIIYHLLLKRPNLGENFHFCQYSLLSVAVKTKETS